ncbi:hypothetical protein VTO73DRAFT_4504 [Trametes versicolor]
MSRPIKVAEDLIHQIPSDLFFCPLDARPRGLLFTARDEVILQRLSSLTAPCFVLSLLDAIYESAKVSIAMQRRRVAPRARWAKVRSVSHTSPAAALSRAREVVDPQTFDLAPDFPVFRLRSTGHHSPLDSSGFRSDDAGNGTPVMETKPVPTASVAGVGVLERLHMSKNPAFCHPSVKHRGGTRPQSVYNTS